MFFLDILDTKKHCIKNKRTFEQKDKRYEI